MQFSNCFKFGTCQHPSIWYTVGCRYKYNTILYRSLQWMRQNINQGFNTQKTLMGNLWGVLCEEFEENWPCYKSITLYFTNHWFTKLLINMQCNFKQPKHHWLCVPSLPSWIWTRMAIWLCLERLCLEVAAQKCLVSRVSGNNFWHEDWISSNFQPNLNIEIVGRIINKNKCVQDRCTLALKLWQSIQKEMINVKHMKCLKTFLLFILFLVVVYLCSISLQSNVSHMAHLCCWVVRGSK